MRCRAMIYVEHILVALLFPAIVGFIAGNWWAGAPLASAYFVGREVAQAELRWIEVYSQGLRANMPWWGYSTCRFGLNSTNGLAGSVRCW